MSNTDERMNEQQLEDLEQLLQQSMMGFHHLFERGSIAEILKRPTEEMDFFNLENMDMIQKLFNQLVQKKTIEEKQAFIESLGDKDYEILLRTYFHLVDSTLYSQTEVRH